MRTGEVALQIYGCGHALETPVMYWKLLIEVRCRDIILRLADSTSLLQFCHTQKTVCFGGVEPHVRVVPVQTFFDYTEREKFLRDNTELQAYHAELAVVPELLDRACTLRLVRFSYPDYTKECFFVVRRVFRNKQNSYLYFNNLSHLRFHLTATNGMPFDDGANAEWPAAHHHRGLWRQFPATRASSLGVVSTTRTTRRAGRALRCCTASSRQTRAPRSRCSCTITSSRVTARSHASS